MLSKLNIWQLKADLYTRNLKVSGSKNGLILRLSEALEKACVAQENDANYEEPGVSLTLSQPDTGVINKERSQIKKDESAQSDVASSLNRKE